MSLIAEPNFSGAKPLVYIIVSMSIALMRYVAYEEALRRRKI